MSSISQWSWKKVLEVTSTISWSQYRINNSVIILDPINIYSKWQNEFLCAFLPKPKHKNSVSYIVSPIIYVFTWEAPHDQFSKVKSQLFRKKPLYTKSPIKISNYFLFCFTEILITGLVLRPKGKKKKARKCSHLTFLIPLPIKEHTPREVPPILTLIIPDIGNLKKQDYKMETIF